MRETVFLKLLHEQQRLLIEVMFRDIFHELVDIFLFLFHEVVEGHFHPHEHGVDISSDLLDSHVLLPIEEVVLGCELFPELLAPFC